MYKATLLVALVIFTAIAMIANADQSDTGTLRATIKDQGNLRIPLNVEMQPRIPTETSDLRILTSAVSRPLSVPQSAPNIDVSGKLSSDSVQRGRNVRATLVMNIPGGYHVNSSRPLEKFLIPTQLQIEAAKGLLVGPVTYPRPLIRKLKFSKNQVAVYEGSATMRFSVTVPANFAKGKSELKAHLRYQSCNDDVCFPPKTRDLSLWLDVK